MLAVVSDKTCLDVWSVCLLVHSFVLIQARLVASPCSSELHFWCCSSDSIEGHSGYAGQIGQHLLEHINLMEIKEVNIGH